MKIITTLILSAISFVGFGQVVVAPPPLGGITYRTLTELIDKKTVIIRKADEESLELKVIEKKSKISLDGNDVFQYQMALEEKERREKKEGELRLYVMTKKYFKDER